MNFKPVRRPEQKKDEGVPVYLGYRSNQSEFGAGGCAVPRLSGKVTHNQQRLAMCQELEHIILTNVPYPYDIKFDLYCNQPPFFDCFIYTEFGRGLLLMTQSVEINHRLMMMAAEDGDGDPTVLLRLMDSLADKYQLSTPPDQFPDIESVVFLPGTNRMNLLDMSAVARLLDEDPEVMVKPHPLTHEETFRRIRQVFGHDRMLDPKSSGFHFLSSPATKRVYTTTSSETFYQAVLLGKQVFDISNYEFASGGTYSHLNTVLAKALKQGGQAEAERVLANIFSSPLSGIMELDLANGVKPEDVATRVRRYVEQSLELREHFRLVVRPARF